ncbi:MAG: polysaccharide biosynthesis tyrosine autokinase [Pirellulales bacterium]|nr:polysaccharide biosynthesis tyrosine autokinase [Pirellulales bacterium]
MKDISGSDRGPAGPERTLVPVVPSHAGSNGHGPTGGSMPEEVGQGSPPATPLGPSLAWHAFCRWWHLCIPTGILLASALAAGVWWGFEPTYVAEAWLRIETANPFIFFTEGRAAAATADRFERTQVELICSPVVLDRVLEQPEIASLPEVLTMVSPVSTLESKLSVESENESDLFRVRFESPVARNAQLIANAVVKQYLGVQDDEEAERTRRIVELIEAEVRKRSEELHDLRSTVQSLQDEIGIDIAVPPNELRDGLRSGSPLAELMRQLTSSQVEREVLVARLTAYQETLANPPEPAAGRVDDMVDQVVEESVEFQQLEQDLADKWRLLRETIRFASLGDKDPKAVRIQTDIRDLQRQKEELRSQLEARMTPSLQARMARQRRNELAAEIAQMQINIEIHETVEAYLKQKIEAHRNGEGSDRSDAQSTRLQYARSDLARAEEVFQRLLERVDMLKTESRAPSRITVLRPAELPLAPEEAIPLKAMSAAGLGGLALPFLLALLWEFRIQRVTTGSQISHHPGLPLLAEVPTLPCRPWPTIARSSNRFESQRARFQDSVHYLCRSLLLSEGASDLQVLAVTSAVSGEGKTTLASQLAASCALYCQERVLLIDGDMRNPRIGELLDTPESPGLADLLGGSNGAAADSVIIKEHLGLLDILPAGKLDRHPHAVLRAGKLEKLLEELRRCYRYIIIDTPPVAGVGEALTICRSVDATLLCVRQDWSRQAQVQMAYERLLAIGARTIGVVLSGVSYKRYASAYGFYAAPGAK